MLMRRFMIEEGMAKPEEFKDVNQGDVTDIRSMSRLRLIFDTNVRQAYGYGKWKQGMKPAVRRAFPAARFVRVRDVMAPRPRHADHLGEVRLKTDRAWWADYQNDPQIGGFGVPWEPYGFHSGMGQEDVSREEAERLGLRFDTREEEMESQPGLNDGLSTSTKGMDPELKRRLIEELEGMRPKRRRSIEEAAREAAAEARQRALERRGLAPVQSGPAVVVDEGDKIRLLESRPPGEAVPPPTMREFKQPELTSPDGQPVHVPDDLFRRLMSDMDHEGDQGYGGDWEPLDHLSEAAREIVIAEESKIAGRAREHGRVIDSNGLITWRGTGGERSISVPSGETTGKVFTHNHPDNNPPSWRDLVEGIADGTLELRVATEGATYAVRFPRDTTPDLLLLEDFFRGVGAATRNEWRRQRGRGDDEDSAIRVEHAVLMELARRGLIEYRRTSR